MSSKLENLTGTRRRFVVAVIILASFMQSLDSTIANVALPFMQGALSAAQDQISWVVTSYMVALAIGTALCGFLAERFGPTNVFVSSIVVFTVSSVLCAISQTLPEIAAFRLIQGFSASAVIPLSQAQLMSLYPKERQGAAIAIWGLGSMMAPVMGPTIGGYLTEMLNWRWIFLINVPVGVVAICGVVTLFPKTPPQSGRAFNHYGFSFLAIGAASLQLMLDRGPTLDWFSSHEVVIEAIVSALSFYLFVVHMITSPAPFLDRGLFKDRNFVAGLFITFCFQGIVSASMVLWPTMIQTLMGYPIITTGLILMPRGLAAMIGMAAVARLLPRYGAAPLMLIGIAFSMVSVWMASQFNVDVSVADLAAVGFIQGLGMGLTFVPANTLSYATLSARLVNAGAPLSALFRNISSSIAISTLVAMVSHYTIVNHAVLTESINMFNRRGLGNMPIIGNEQQTIAMLDSVIVQQATMIAYCNAFLAMTYAMLFLPLALLVMRRGSSSALSSTQTVQDI